MGRSRFLRVRLHNPSAIVEVTSEIHDVVTPEICVGSYAAEEMN